MKCLICGRKAKEYRITITIYNNSGVMSNDHIDLRCGYHNKNTRFEIYTEVKT